MKRRAFTLLELMLAVSIVGVLAAIAMPRLSTAGGQAGLTGLRADWSRLQRQIDLYAVEHGGAFPSSVGDGTNAAHSAAAFLAQMTKFTDIDGKASNVRTNRFSYGPYLSEGLPPLKVGPLAGLNNLRVVTGATQLVEDTNSSVAWLYHDMTGEIMPNVNGARDDVGVSVLDHGALGVGVQVQGAQGLD